MIDKDEKERLLNMASRIERLRKRFDALYIDAFMVTNEGKYFLSYRL